MSSISQQEIRRLFGTLNRPHRDTNVHHQAIMCKSLKLFSQEQLDAIFLPGERLKVVMGSAYNFSQRGIISTNYIRNGHLVTRQTPALSPEARDRLRDYISAYDAYFMIRGNDYRIRDPDSKVSLQVAEQAWNDWVVAYLAARGRSCPTWALEPLPGLQRVFPMLAPAPAPAPTPHAVATRTPATPHRHYPQVTLPTPPPSSPAPVAGSLRKRPIIIDDDEDNALCSPAKKTFLGFVDLSHDEDEEEVAARPWKKTLFLGFISNGITYMITAELMLPALLDLLDSQLAISSFSPKFTHPRPCHPSASYNTHNAHFWDPDFTFDFSPISRADDPWCPWIYSGIAIRWPLWAPLTAPLALWCPSQGVDYFITTNTDYIPTLPSLKVPHVLFLCSDMRYGTDNPVLWPQEWTDDYCHFSAIAEPGLCPDIDVMWWDPSPADFEVGISPPINQLMAQCTDMRKTSKVPPLIGELINTVLMWVEQLQTLPSTYIKMQLFVACLPFWFLRPFYVIDAENILAIVELQEPTSIAGPSTFAPPIVYSGNNTQEKMTAILHAAIQTPRYQDPFATGSSLSSLPTPSSSTQLLSMQATASSSTSVAPSNNQQLQSRYRPYPANSPKKSGPPKQISAQSAAKGPAAKPQRDKFAYLAMDGMPPSIGAWAAALANINQSVVPFTSDPADKRYVLPEPALFVNSTPDRRRKFLHHWNLLSDLFIYMLSQQGHAELLSAQEWRDVLEGPIAKRGEAGSRTNRRSAGVEKHIQCLNTLQPEGPRANLANLPVPLESLPEFSLEQTQEIIWQVAESSFHFEFCSLDRRASKMNQLDGVKVCFASGMLLGVPLEIGKRGWAAPAIKERHCYVLWTMTLMLDWTTKSACPNIIRRVADCLPWTPGTMQDLENAVCSYYTQAFWEYFGRAAVVPLRLEHELEKEEGEL
ncbi:hypothetical protein C8J57DRAFT_1529142 [Mycena rebaudengoi]|nr:hypothetical protein C8J57DRAFT_1529142 [Mycena rebaudengoi]